MSNIDKPKPKPKRICFTCHVNECLLGWTLCEKCWWEKKFRWPKRPKEARP